MIERLRLLIPFELRLRQESVVSERSSCIRHVSLQTILLLLLPITTGITQNISVRVDNPCMDCIRLSRVVTLSGQGRARPIATPPLVVKRNSQGRAYLALEDPMEPPLVFAPTGKFHSSLGKLARDDRHFFDRGYLVRPTMVEFTRGDTILVIDEGQQRINIFSPTGTFRYSVPLEIPVALGFGLGNGILVSTDYVASAEVAGFPAHLLSRNGERLVSFGDVETILPDRWRPQFAGVGGGLGTIWLAPRQSYRLQEWDRHGLKVRELVRTAAWFPDSRGGVVSATKPPPVHIRAIDVDTLNNHMWVFVAVVDPLWKLGIRREESHEGTWYRVFEWETVFDTQIEVIDLTTNSLLASTRVPQVIGYVPRRGEVASLRGTYGNAIIDIWRAELIEPRSPRQR